MSCCIQFLALAVALTSLASGQISLAKGVEAEISPISSDRPQPLERIGDDIKYEFKACVSFREPASDCRFQCRTRIVALGDDAANAKHCGDSLYMPIACFCVPD